MKMKYSVDIPDSNNVDNTLVNMGYFETRREAIDWAMTNLGADEKGNIKVVSKLPD